MTLRRIVATRQGPHARAGHLVFVLAIIGKSRARLSRADLLPENFTANGYQIILLGNESGL